MAAREDSARPGSVPPTTGGIMKVQERLAAYLQEQGVDFSTHRHPQAFTAQEVAASEHVSGHRFVKVVMVKGADDLAMVCVPASLDVDLGAVADMLDVDEVRLAEETEFAPLFGDCEVGAMPPFGNLYHVPVYLDEALEEDEKIVFNAGTHRETFEMSVDDFERLVHPKVARFAIAH
jgi:Ala-tRNA(Pro) deacylase